MRTRSAHWLRGVGVVGVMLGASMMWTATTGAAATFSPGSAGLGDPYFPLDGNGGYNVKHYLLEIKYDPATDVLTGKATISTLAKQNLSQFNLDFVGLTIESIKVGGRAAEWKRNGGELTVIPHSGIPKGDSFTTVVRYEGVPEPIEDAFGTSGVIPTDDGVVIVGQPHVAATWFPANDHPLDKAAYTFRITVPAGLEAIANGKLERKQTSGGWTTWTWKASEPMASYLATTAVGEFDLHAYRIDGLPYWDATSTPSPRRETPRTSA
jgi:aminopeptidase N